MTSLASGAKHGYALARDIERFAGVTLGPGTLYGAITALEEHGLIEPTGHDERTAPVSVDRRGTGRTDHGGTQSRRDRGRGCSSPRDRVALPDPGLGAMNPRDARRVLRWYPRPGVAATVRS